MKLVINSIFISTLLFCNIAHCENVEVYKKKSKMNNNEISMMKKIKSVYPDFHYSSNVIRYYKKHLKQISIESSFLVEVVFEKDNELIFDEYLTYTLTFEPESKIVNYSFDAGTAYRGEGSIIVLGDKIINTQWVCGTSGCDIYVYENNKLVYSSEKGKKSE